MAYGFIQQIVGLALLTALGSLFLWFLFIGLNLTVGVHNTVRYFIY